jgi:hypothetical protein
MAPAVEAHQRFGRAVELEHERQRERQNVVRAGCCLGGGVDVGNHRPVPRAAHE